MQTRPVKYIVCICTLVYFTFLRPLDLCAFGFGSIIARSSLCAHHCALIIARSSMCAHCALIIVHSSLCVHICVLIIVYSSLCAHHCVLLVVLSTELQHGALILVGSGPGAATSTTWIGLIRYVSTPAVLICLSRIRSIVEDLTGAWDIGYGTMEHGAGTWGKGQ